MKQMSFKTRPASTRRSTPLQQRQPGGQRSYTRQNTRSLMTLKGNTKSSLISNSATKMTSSASSKLSTHIKGGLKFNAVSFFHNSAKTSAPQLHQYQQEKAQPKFVQRPVLLHEEVLPEHIRFGPVKKHTTGGGQYVPLTYGPNDRPLRIQTPPVRIPFGMRHFGDGSRTVQLAISLDNLRTDKEMKGFYDLLSRVDERVTNVAIKESKAWFKRDLPPDVIRANYRSSVKQSEKGEYAPLLNLKIQLDKNNRPAIEVYSNHDLAPSELLMNRGSKILAIIEPRSLWFLGGTTFGISWVALQVKILETGGSGRLVGYGFIEDEPLTELPEEMEDRE